MSILKHDISCNCAMCAHAELSSTTQLKVETNFYRPPAPPRLAETQKSISDWAVETFGPTGSNLRVALRMNNEMAELIDKLAVDDNDENALVEAADIVIVAMRLFERKGVNFWDVVETKMAVNRAREWKKDGTGCGQHV